MVQTNMMIVIYSAVHNRPHTVTDESVPQRKHNRPKQQGHGTESRDI